MVTPGCFTQTHARYRKALSFRCTCKCLSSIFPIKTHLCQFITNFQKLFSFDCETNRPVYENHIRIWFWNQVVNASDSLSLAVYNNNNNNNKDLLTRVLIRYTSIFHMALNTTQHSLTTITTCFVWKGIEDNCIFQGIYVNIH